MAMLGRRRGGLITHPGIDYKNLHFRRVENLRFSAKGEHFRDFGHFGPLYRGDHAVVPGPQGGYRYRFLSNDDGRRAEEACNPIVSLRPW